VAIARGRSLRSRRDRKAALMFLKRTMKRYGRPRSIVTDRLRSYGSAMKVLGNLEFQEYEPFGRSGRMVAACGLRSLASSIFEICWH
jgi:transposase-like protein